LELIKIKSTNPFNLNKIYFIPYILTKLDEIKTEIDYISSSICINKEFDKKLHLNYFLSLVNGLKIIIGVD